MCGLKEGLRDKSTCRIKQREGKKGERLFFDRHQMKNGNEMDFNLNCIQKEIDMCALYSHTNTYTKKNTQKTRVC